MHVIAITFLPSAQCGAATYAGAKMSVYKHTHVCDLPIRASCISAKQAHGGSDPYTVVLESRVKMENLSKKYWPKLCMGYSNLYTTEETDAFILPYIGSCDPE